MAKLMKRILLLIVACYYSYSASALQVTQNMQTSIGIFDACKQSFTFSFFRNTDYDIKTSLQTTGTFGSLYPFKAIYHAVGIYNKQNFVPQNYFYEAKSRFRYRTKEIIYKDGIPQQRISTKDDYKRIDDITIDTQYESSMDLLSTTAVLIEQVVRTGKCDISRHSFDGKKYALNTWKTLGKERIKTPYFSGRALKCEYKMEVFDDADAGFLVDTRQPIYVWILYDKQTKAPFVAKVLIKKTPFGKLEALTTDIEVKK